MMITNSLEEEERKIKNLGGSSILTGDLVVGGTHKACGTCVVLAGNPEDWGNGLGSDKLGKLHLVRLPHLMLGDKGEKGKKEIRAVFSDALGFHNKYFPRPKFWILKFFTFMEGEASSK